MSQAGRMKYRVIGTDPATRRSVSVLSLGAGRSGHGRRLVRRLWLSAGVGGATHCDPYVAEA